MLSKKFMKKIKKDKNISGVVLFGSYSRKEERFSDIDICLMLKPKKYTNSFLTKIRFKYLGLVPENIDIQIFQQLPLYIQMRILKEGRFLVNKNLKETFKVALHAIKEFELFKPHYYYYLKSVANERI